MGKVEELRTGELVSCSVVEGPVPVSVVGELDFIENSMPVSVVGVLEIDELG